MIYLAGDTHGFVDIKKLNTKNFPEQKTLTKNDYVIVLGDFGVLWHNDSEYQYLVDIYNKKPFTTLWLDGNHENHDWINSLDIGLWHDRPVHYISDSIIHLMRGYDYIIDNKKFLVLGGAASYDREYRVEGISWWPRELWNMEEENRLFDLLAEYDKTGQYPEYILSHTCPKEIVEYMFHIYDSTDPTEKLLNKVSNHLEGRFKAWYFGHWHQDIARGKYHCLYNQLIKL